MLTAVWIGALLVVLGAFVYYARREYISAKRDKANQTEKEGGEQ